MSLLCSPGQDTVSPSEIESSEAKTDLGTSPDFSTWQFHRNPLQMVNLWSISVGHGTMQKMVVFLAAPNESRAKRSPRFKQSPIVLILECTSAQHVSAQPSSRAPKKILDAGKGSMIV